ncbi:hypothetical protein KP509_10G048200 [Ceratopteris richardii]|uniref:Uncharacterized protein n=1 Tax=Ceratopteris richardii TaxID=49495 RepID=A0A8T2TYQ5_CERRI|nr:hypothetical protein KP509_10G048200 [Ceratopteris richardii]
MLNLFCCPSYVNMKMLTYFIADVGHILSCAAGGCHHFNSPSFCLSPPFASRCRPHFVVLFGFLEAGLSVDVPQSSVFVGHRQCTFHDLVEHRNPSSGSHHGVGLWRGITTPLSKSWCCWASHDKSRSPLGSHRSVGASC